MIRMDALYKVRKKSLFIDMEWNDVRDYIIETRSAYLFLDSAIKRSVR